MKTRTSKTSETSERVWRTHTHTQIAFKRHLPSCDHEAFRCYPPMNIKYKHSSKFSTPGLYFMPLSWHNKHISFSLPNSAPKMNLSPLYKIICQHYMCWWIIHEGSWRVSAPYESWRKPSWQTPRFCTRTGSRERKSGGFSEKNLLLEMIYSPLYSLWRVLIHTGMRAVQMKMQDHFISIELS